MGLDISAYETVTLKKAASLKAMQAKGWDDPLYDDGEHQFFYDWHPKSEAKEGFYAVGGEHHGFRAGSYGGYNQWRAQLAALVGTTPERVWKGQAPPAFGELINFSDCEGAIDAKVSAKLAKDFADWQDRANAFEADRWFLELYAAWRKAFEIAAKGGAVKFH